MEQITVSKHGKSVFLISVNERGLSVAQILGEAWGGYTLGANESVKVDGVDATRDDIVFGGSNVVISTVTKNA